MNELLVDIYSFGYIRSGIPADESGNKGGFVFDCRFLLNPGAHTRFMFMTGLDNDVRAFLAQQDATQEFLVRIIGIIDEVVASYTSLGYTHLHVAFGCTGGQHRSVYCAEKLAAHLREMNVRCSVTHTEKKYWP